MESNDTIFWVFIVFMILLIIFFFYMAIVTSKNRKKAKAYKKEKKYAAFDTPQLLGNTSDSSIQITSMTENVFLVFMLSSFSLLNSYLQYFKEYQAE